MADPFPATPATRELWRAAGAGKSSKVAKLATENAADVNWPNRGCNGATPLHIAVMNSQKKTVAKLLELGADVSRKMLTDLNTPLHRACMNDDADCVELLLTAGASTDAANQYGNAPAHAACMAASEACVRLIAAAPVDQAPRAMQNQGGVQGILPIKRVPRFAARNNKGSTPLHFLAYASKDPGDAVLGLVLAQDGVLPGEMDDDGATPLCIAARNGHTKLAVGLAALGEKGAPGCDAVELDSAGKCAAGLALAYGHAALSKLLLAGRPMPIARVGMLHLAQMAAAQKATSEPASMPPTSTATRGAGSAVSAAAPQSMKKTAASDASAQGGAKAKPKEKRKHRMFGRQ